MEYRDALKQKYAHAPEVRRVLRSHHLPKPIYKARKLKHEMAVAEKRKADNVRRHAPPEKRAKRPTAERAKPVVAEQQ